MTVVITQIDPRGVATVILNRPERHNALNQDLITALTQAATDLGADPQVRVVVLTGVGPSFCAGGDLRWMMDQIQADGATRAAQARSLARLLSTWNSLPKPVIARIQGPAFGGGVGLACVADMALAVDTARFGLTETRLGLIPATIGPHVMARLGPAGRQVFMSSRRFDAADALRLGLIARAVPADQLDQMTEAEVVPYLSAAPAAVASAKRLALRQTDPVTPAMIEASIADLVAQWETPEAREGIAAFLEKRAPLWDRS